MVHLNVTRFYLRGINHVQIVPEGRKIKCRIVNRSNGIILAKKYDGSDQTMYTLHLKSNEV
jgi:hypothetical protein